MLTYSSFCSLTLSWSFVSTIFLMVQTGTVKSDLEIQETERSFYRIETELLHFENTNNTNNKGKRCDLFTKCDPVFYGYLDLEKPLSPWPGSLRKLQDHQYLGGQTNVESPKLKYVVAKSLCGGMLNTANLRVEIYDYDMMSKSDLIDQFECRFVPNLVGESAKASIWSQPINCKTVHRPEQHKLKYRWRVHSISPDDCGMIIKT